MRIAATATLTLAALFAACNAPLVHYAAQCPDMRYLPDCGTVSTPFLLPDGAIQNLTVRVIVWHENPPDISVSARLRDETALLVRWPAFEDFFDLTLPVPEFCGRQGGDTLWVDVTDEQPDDVGYLGLVEVEAWLRS